MLSLEKLPHRSPFPPEDMRFNDSLRVVPLEQRYTLHVHNTCNIKAEGRRGVLHLELVLYDKVRVPLYLLLFLITSLGSTATLHFFLGSFSTSKMFLWPFQVRTHHFHLSECAYFYKTNYINTKKLLTIELLVFRFLLDE